jgi:antitoxin ParD1/3/4
MPKIEVSLPDEFMEFLQQQVKSGGYEDASEYLQGLIEGERLSQAQLRLEALLMEGLTSGEPKEMTDADWDDLQREVLERIEARKSA